MDCIFFTWNTNIITAIFGKWVNALKAYPFWIFRSLLFDYLENCETY
jgi:hypothetical protein